MEEKEELLLPVVLQPGQDRIGQDLSPVIRDDPALGAVGIEAPAEPVHRIEKSSPGERLSHEAVPPQKVGQDGKLRVHPVRGGAHAVIDLVQAGQEGDVRGKRPRRRGEGVLEQDRVGGQIVQAGARGPAVAVAGEMVGPKGVQGDQDNARPVLLGPEDHRD